MARPPSIQWYYKQWLGDNKVQGMEWDAYGMHFHLLNLSIQEEPPGSLPNDMALIRRWLRNPSDDVWRRVQSQVFSAWKLRDGRWFNDGMVEAMERQRKYRERYENGTRRGANHKEDKEEVNVLEVGFDLEDFDHEKAVREIQQAHPRKENSQANEIAVLEAIEYVVKQRNCKRREAAEWLLSRTKMYHLATDNWPDKQFITKSTRWFTSRSFEEDPQFWERKNNGNTNHRPRGNPQCADCHGAGIRASKLTPGRTVVCECVPGEVAGTV